MTSDQLDDTWHSGELPVLIAAVRGVDQRPRDGASGEQIAEWTGLDLAEVYRAGRALDDADFVRMRQHWGGGELLPSMRFEAVSAEARQLAGTWPTPQTSLDRMIAALEAIASNADADADTRGRARRALDGLRGAGRDVLVASLATAIGGNLPGVT